MRRSVTRAVAALLTGKWLLVLAVVEVGLRLFPLPRLCRLLGVRLDLESGGPATGVWPVPQVFGRTARAVLRATRWWPFGDTCLRRCLLLARALREFSPIIRIGVRREENGAFSAHSWLEVGGASLDPMSDRFATLAAAGADPR